MANLPRPSQLPNPTMINGEFVLTTRHILQAMKATGFSKGDSGKAVALELLDRCPDRVTWFEAGFDWKLALRWPDLLLASRVNGKLMNGIFPISLD